MNYEKIKPYIEKGLISEKVHPEDENVRIFNYTQECQFSKAWDDVTRQCRGLILNVKTGEVLARPFPKFFNYSEHVFNKWPIPDGTPVISEKLDGSLGILYVLKGRPWIATRGSFTSDQAIWATNWWRKNIGDVNPIDETNLFEIIYPENRIVVNYNFEGLVHLATIVTSTGVQVNKPWADTIQKAKTIPATSLEELEKMDEPNSEGFVLFYPEENVRMKIKFPEYVRLHKIVTGISEIGIWEFLRDGKELKDILVGVPDEFFAWVTQVENRLRGKFNEVKNKTAVQYAAAMSAAHPEQGVEVSRKEKAEAIKKYMERPGFGFTLLDARPIDPEIWKVVRPHGKTVFKVDIDL